MLACRYQSLVREADAHKATGEQAADQLKNHALEYMSRMKSAQLHRSRHRQLWEEAYKCAPQACRPHPVFVIEGLSMRSWDAPKVVPCMLLHVRLRWQCAAPLAPLIRHAVHAAAAELTWGL